MFKQAEEEASGILPVVLRKKFLKPSNTVMSAKKPPSNFMGSKLIQLYTKSVISIKKVGVS